MRMTQRELEVIKTAFKGNDELLRVMRKWFLPTIDGTEPITQIIDLWMTVKVDDLTPEQALINIKARNSLIQHIEHQLNMLKILANDKDLERIEEMKRKNSAK